MSKENTVSAIETIEVKATPAKVGTNCVICDGFISLVYGYYGCNIPATKICDECKNRLMRVLYDKEGS